MVKSDNPFNIQMTQFTSEYFHHWEDKNLANTNMMKSFVEFYI